MCFDPAARPPITPIAGAAVDGERVELEAGDGTRFIGYAAQADAPSGAGMLVLPDVRGMHPYYEELALRFAEAGVDALAIDYFGRTAGTAERPADFDFMSHVARASYPALVADMAAAAASLRQRRAVRSLFTIGFCFGGRLSYLAATRPELDAAGVISFYGWPLGPSRVGPLPIDLVAEMACPVLGIFGGSDDGIPGEHIERFEHALSEAGIEHELVAYPGAPHSFFDRKAEQFAEASTDAWQRVLAFVGRLSAQ